MATATKKKPTDPATAFRRAGLTRPHDVLLWAPKRFEDYSFIVNGYTYHSYAERMVCIKLRATDTPYANEKGKFKVYAVDDAGGEHHLTVFGMFWHSPWARLTPGVEFWIRAKVVPHNSYFYLRNVEWVDEQAVGSIRPVYPGKTGVIAAAAIAAAAAEAVKSSTLVADAVLTIREAFSGMDEAQIQQEARISRGLDVLIRELHAPTSYILAKGALAAAKRLAVAYIRKTAELAGKRPLVVDSIIRISGQQMRALVGGIPFALTSGEASQTEAIRTIIGHLSSPHPMDALLSADVGAGKTVVYGLIAAAAQQVGKRVAILIPNTILVQQVTNELRTFFPHTPICSLSEGDSELPNWTDNPILIGTTRLFSVTERAKWVPDLLVIDEQQKTAEGQRNRLRGHHTNLLETTATPLPRSMALLAHGGKQLIQVRTQHANKVITTSILDSTHKGEMFRKIKARISKSEQVAIIYPRVAASGEDDLKSVVSAGAMWERRFPGQVAVLHGQMKDAEKVEVMDRVKNHRTPILVASSIIEVGVTIKDLRLIMIVHAERYGVFTLHQFRGRLARHGGEGECLLYLPEPVDEESIERLRLLEQTNDGFALAEMDMQLRGFGDLAAAEGSQSGKTRTLFRGLQLMPADFN